MAIKYLSLVLMSIAYAGDNLGENICIAIALQGGVVTINKKIKNNETTHIK